MTLKTAKNIKTIFGLSKKTPDAYSSFADYLGANAMQMCEGCDKIVEYDEVDENGYCFDCQEDEENEEEDEA